MNSGKFARICTFCGLIALTENTLCRKTEFRISPLACKCLRQRKGANRHPFCVGGERSELFFLEPRSGERGRKIDRSQCEMKGDFSSRSNLAFADRVHRTKESKSLSCKGASKAKPCAKISPLACKYLRQKQYQSLLKSSSSLH